MEFQYGIMGVNTFPYNWLVLKSEDSVKAPRAVAWFKTEEAAREFANCSYNATKHDPHDLFEPKNRPAYIIIYGEIKGVIGEFREE